jgi:hypothetical protein
VNSIETILRCVQTEAVEHGGIQEVPDDKYGADYNYHDPKREARAATDPNVGGRLMPAPSEEGVEFRLELLVDDSGRLAWSYGDK